jgi:putative ABC transport system permease protein
MIKNYIKLAIKVLARRKFFTFISLFGISLTLVVLMAATAIFDNLFEPRAPESRFDRVLMVRVMGEYGPQGGRTSSPGYWFLDKYVRGLQGAEAVSVFSAAGPAAIYQAGQKIDTHVMRTDGAYWQIVDFKFLEGGPYTQADDDNGNFVAVINEDLREKFFGGAPAVGKSIQFEGRRFKIVGVVPNVPMTRTVAFSEIWAPNSTAKNAEYQHQRFGGYVAVVLARDKSDFAMLRRNFAERLENYQFEDPKRFNKLVTGLDTPFEAFARMMFGNKLEKQRVLILRLIFLIAALLFITLPTMNLVSINLSRIMERASEIGVRKAFGASSRALVGQFVVENVVLTIIGGAVGFFLTAGALALLNSANPIPHMTFEVNARVFLYGMLIAAAFGVISGVWPAWRMSRMHPVNALRGGAL